MGFNKGEWSELYSFLYLLENPNLLIVNENLEVIEGGLFEVIEIFLNGTTYKIDINRIIKASIDGLVKEYDLKYIEENYKILLEKILIHKKAKGSFEIDEIMPLINDLFDGKKPKGSSNVKGDLSANVLDKNFSRIVHLNYNIKSSLGSPATLLNASNNTNFIYEVTNINGDLMNQSNSINTRSKLLDRCQLLENNNAMIDFVKVESETFDYNLKMIDSNLDKVLADILYLSYKKNEKNIQNLLSLIAINEDEHNFYKKKLGDFANSVTFGMRAGEKWNGKNEVNGGIILVTKTGEVYLLDLVYFKDIVDKYIIENIKLESPSSTRYQMFDIYKENGKYYFKGTVNRTV